MSPSSPFTGDKDLPTAPNARPRADCRQRLLRIAVRCTGIRQARADCHGSGVVGGSFRAAIGDA